MSREIETAEEWYVLHTYSGYENKVKENLESRTESMGMEDNILEILVPEMESYQKDAEGELERVKEKTFPGYVLVKMIMSDEAWYVVRNTPNVTGFVGSHGAGSKPSPLFPEEVDSVLRSMGLNPRKVQIDLELGQTVRIISGTFSGMEGIVEEIESDKGKVKVAIEMFGRETTTEIDYDQIAELNNY